MIEATQELTEPTTRGAEKWPSWKLQPPPEGDPQVAQWVWKKFQYMRAYRDSLGLPSLWLRFHELLRNRLFKKKSPYTMIPINLVFKTINTLKANLTDNKPRANFMPQGDTPPMVADALQARYDYWWEHTKQQECLQESVGNSELNGFQVDKMIWDTDQENGAGEAATVRCDPFGIFLWPRSMDLQKNPIAHAEAMQLGDIYERWPETEDEVKADPAYSDLLGESRAEVRATKGRDLRPIGGQSDFYQTGEVDVKDRYGQDLGGRALVVEFWCHDFTMEWVDPRNGKKVKKSAELLEPFLHPQTGEPLRHPETGQQLAQLAMDPQTGGPLQPVEQSKYPGFVRCITVVSSGVQKSPMLLSDLANPSINQELPREITSKCYLFDKFPFIKRLSYSDDISEYGLSIVEQIEPLVMEISRKVSQIGMHLHNQAISPLIVPTGSIANMDDVNNLPKRIWKTVGQLGQYIRFLPVPPMSSDYMAYIEMLVQFAESITGLTEVTEGRRPTGITAAHAIAALQEKAQTIFRVKIRNGDLYLEEQGRMFRSLDQNWHMIPLKLAYQGAGSEEQIDYTGIEFQGDVIFHVEAGSTLPNNKAVQRQEMVELAKANMIDQVALLDELKVSKRDEIIDRMKAGPMGMALKKLQTSGLFSPQDLEAIKNVVSMDDQMFKKNFGSGNPLDVAGAKQ